MKKRKILLTLLATMLVATSVFTGCGTEPKEQKEITINFPSIWVAKDSKAKTVTQIINDFNEQNKGKIKVVVEEIPDYSAYADKIRTSVTSGTVPDVFSVSSPADLELFSRAGKLDDLTSYVNDGWKNDFLPNSFNGSTYNNNIYAIPFELGVAPALYNSKLFEQAGIKEFPKTYTELFDAFEKLKAKGIAPATQLTGGNAWTSMLWYSQLLSSIGGQDVYKNGLNDPAFVEAAAVLKKLYNYTTKDAVGLKDPAGHFLNERTAVLLNGPWFIGRIKKEGINNMYDAVKIAPAPYYEGGKGKPGQYLGFTQAWLAVGKQTDKDKEKAIVQFLKFLTKPDNVKKISLESGSLFYIKYDITDNDKVERLQADMLKQLKEAPYIIPHFQASVKPAVANEFPQALEGLVLGKYTPEQFVDRLKKADAK